MSADIRAISARRDTNEGVTPEMALIELLSELRSGKVRANRMLVILVDDQGDEFDMTSRTAGGIRLSEQVAMCEMQKQVILRDIGLT